MTNQIKSNSEGLTEFQVKSASGIKWVIYLILLIVLNLGVFQFPGLYYVSIGMTIVSIIVVPTLWGKIAMKIMRKNLIMNMKEWKTSRKLNIGTKILNAFLGLSLDPEKRYFVERQAKEIDLNSLKEVYKSRIWDVISSCIGLTFLIALGLKYILNATGLLSDTNMIMGFSLIILNISPFLIFWLVPIFWTMNDVDLRSIDNERNVSIIGSEMQNGIFSQFLGFAGILTGIGFFTDLGDEYWNGRGVEGSVQIYIQAAIFLVLFAACIAGTATFITVRYLSSYHQNIVNECRKFFAEILESGETQIIFSKLTHAQSNQSPPSN